MLLFLVLVAAAIESFRPESSTSASMAIRSVEFEVFGRVQGVFFRKYTKEQADKLGLRGWCKNTAQGTVQGHIQGLSDKINEMINWLKNKGSPSSQIDHAEFRNDHEIEEFTFNNFVIKKD